MKTTVDTRDGAIELVGLRILGTAPQEHLDLKAALESVAGALRPEGREQLLTDLQAGGINGSALYDQIAGSLNGNIGLVVDYAAIERAPAPSVSEAAIGLIQATGELTRACEGTPDWGAISGHSESVFTHASALLSGLSDIFANYEQYTPVPVKAPDIAPGGVVWTLDLPPKV